MLVESAQGSRVQQQPGSPCLPIPAGLRGGRCLKQTVNKGNVPAVLARVRPRPRVTQGGGVRRRPHRACAPAEVRCPALDTQTLHPVHRKPLPFKPRSPNGVKDAGEQPKLQTATPRGRSHMASCAGISALGLRGSVRGTGVSRLFALPLASLVLRGEPRP